MNIDDLNKRAEKFSEYLDSPEGQKWTDDYFNNLKVKQETENRHIERFKALWGDKLDQAIEKLITKYSSDKYRDREYRMGIEPREDLFWLAYGYAQKYCPPCKNEKYLNMFTADAYYIGSYVVQRMDGQGSVVQFTKIV